MHASKAEKQKLYFSNTFTKHTHKTLHSKELSQGSFHMLHDLNAHRGKVFPASALPTPVAVPKLPDLLSLSDSPGSLPDCLPSRGLLAVSFKQFGYDMLPSWTAALNPSVPVTNLVVGDGGVLKLFRGFLASSLRKSVKKEKWKTTYTFNGDHSSLREGLEMTNTLTGYVFYIVDGKVVWRGCGNAESEVSVD